MTNWVHPVVPVIVTDNFGMRFHPIYHEMRLHRGCDYYCTYGQVVRAAAGGVVIWVGYNGGEGNSVHIRHDDGTITKSFHNSTITVSRGERVVKGQQIAGAGSTGDSTGVHCHFEVHIDGTPVNPELFFAQVGADGVPDISSLEPVPLPVIEPPKRNGMPRMFFAFNTTGTGMLVGITGKRRGMPSLYHYQLCQRVILGRLGADGKPLIPWEVDTLLDAELDIVSAYMKSVAPDSQPNIDTAKLITDIGTYLNKIGVKTNPISATELAAIVGSSLDEMDIVAKLIAAIDAKGVKVGPESLNAVQNAVTAAVLANNDTQGEVTIDKLVAQLAK